MNVDFKRALVTGGAGFIGSQLVRDLDALGVNVLVLDNLSFGKKENIRGLKNTSFLKVDLRDSRKLESAVKSFKPDVCFHLAALHFIPYCEQNPLECLDVNVTGTANLLNSLSKIGLKKFLFVSSAAVYAPSKKPHKEDDVLEPQDIYGHSKLAGEYLVKDWSNETGIPTVIVRQFNAYGPRETNPHLLPAIAKQLNGGSRVIELGNLTPERDYVHTRDISRLFIKLVSAIDEFSVVNLGYGVGSSVKDVVTFFSKHIGFKIKIKAKTGLKRRVDRPFLIANISKLKALVKDKPTFGLMNNIKDVFYI